MPTLHDKWVIIAILVISLISFGLLALLDDDHDIEYTVYIEENKNQILQMNLNQTNDGIYPFEFSNGIGQLEVKGERVRVLPMTKIICPQSICSITGWIDSRYETIVCLPNKIQVILDTKES